MGRMFLGLIKGGLLGAIAGYFASSAGIFTGPLALAVYAGVGALVGLICGKPLWKQETIWTPILKALFGAGVGLGLSILGRKFLGTTFVSISAIPGALVHPLGEVPALLAPIVGAAYGIFVEFDDGADAAKSNPAR